MNKKKLFVSLIVLVLIVSGLFVSNNLKKKNNNEKILGAAVNNDDDIIGGSVKSSSSTTIVKASMSMSSLYLAQADEFVGGVHPYFMDENGKTVSVSDYQCSSNYPAAVSTSKNNSGNCTISSHYIDTGGSSVTIRACLQNEKTNNKKICAETKVRVGCTAWRIINISKDNYPSSSSVANSRASAQGTGKGYYDDNSTGCNGDNCTIWSRWCGTPTPPTTEEYACYGDANTLAKSRNVKWQTGPSGIYQYKVGTSQSGCVVDKPKDVISCNSNSISQGNISKSLGTCSGPLELSDKFGDNCMTVSSSSFYRITCEEKLIVNFNYNNPGTIKERLGIDYKLKAESEVTCKGTFDSGSFLASYDNVLYNLSLENLTEEERLSYEGLKSSLEGVVDAYNSWNGIRYDMNQIKPMFLDLNNNNTIYFIDDIYIPGSATWNYTSTNYLGISGVSNPRDFIYKYNVSRSYKLPKGYYNYKTRTVLYDNCSTCVPLDYAYYVVPEVVKNNNFPFKILVNNLGYQGKWSADARCSLNVWKYSPIYRTIDINNPFISSSRKIGANWSNSIFGFQNIIKNTDNATLYAFDVSKENFRTINENTTNTGIGVLLGQNCSYGSNKYTCSFIRDNRFFTNITIND